ncbi:hypothetical protein EJB05_02742 [Eragrostis curvula]|uniref:Uncharacterized protein n=1 Tax=Eragrostis curvula TaxID=38414 RepID=A0A5J9WWB1_9POAL|nr:hypothetical protein EJB05_02742 [Eragrostis curvula]
MINNYCDHVNHDMDTDAIIDAEALFPAQEMLAGAAHAHHVEVKTGMLFLKKTLVPGAVLPEGTLLFGTRNSRLRETQDIRV